ncbi:MAG TPA: GAF domain-containing protein [Humidesulfovibrio sp.]|uniref:GAF domain-containing protein n=1 Tax=Humidesulfovibrio sp. TaxID=2910988 RepID=UPI002C2979DC|nr:GAF domain-containing protein [Humidesulfovibrio sp.]HWR04077.1 GAF domain-containing protein [Humidesulfovibrio sp.]
MTKTPDRFERYFRTLADVARVVNSSLETGNVLSAVTEQTTKAVRAKGCTLRLLDRSGKRLLPSAAFGLSKEYFRKGSVELAHSEVDREVLAGKTIQIPNAQNDPRFQYGEAAKKEGIVTVLVTPLMVDGHAIGVMRIYTTTERSFDEASLDFLHAVADISAMAIENARLHQALKTDYEMLASYEHRIFED